MTREVKSGGYTLRFIACQKPQVEARRLTEQDYNERDGIVQTLEGPRNFEPGDWLARDHKGVWPIESAKMTAGYVQTSEQDGDGWATFQVRGVRFAAQMPVTFTVAGLEGKSGDYLVTGSRNLRTLKIRKVNDNEPIQITGIDAWPVDRAIYEETYEEVHWPRQSLIQRLLDLIDSAGKLLRHCHTR